MYQSGGQYLFDMRARGDWVRLRTLILLRWIAVIGQSGAVLIAAVAMDFQLPLALCATLISAAVVANLFAVFAFPPETRLSENATLASLMFDLVQIVALLMVTGGLNNPFALLVLAPVTISASTLRLQPTLWLGTAAIAMIAVTSSVYLPLIGPDGAALQLPLHYRAGYAAALAVAVGFLTLYGRRVTVESYAMSQALSATQVALSREQRLSAIGAIAAAAAHELGTPLATIKLAAKELKNELADRPDLAEDAALIHAEAERCGRIMAELSESRKQDTHMQTAPITAVIAEAAAPHADRGIEIVIAVDGVAVDEAGHAGADGADIPIVARGAELIHGLRNLIQNAVDFAEGTVRVEVHTGETSLELVVSDDGPGIAADVLPRLGEPYITTRGAGHRSLGLPGSVSSGTPGGVAGDLSGQMPGDLSGDAYEGMGLGVFIARTLLERTGARLSFANGPDGALARVRWPVERISLSRLPTRRYSRLSAPEDMNAPAGSVTP
ncbi:MAG: ActS/PrrB/RegB family redox-sensitive histidine kinase [Pseudomonadota bacterium]